MFFASFYLIFKGSSNAGNMVNAMSHNLTLGNLPFTALLQSSGGLPFPHMQPTALGVGLGSLGGMLGQARPTPGVPCGPTAAECVPRQNFNEIEVISENGKENFNAKYLLTILYLLTIPFLNALFFHFLNTKAEKERTRLIEIQGRE